MIRQKQQNQKGKFFTWAPRKHFVASANARDSLVRRESQFRADWEAAVPDARGPWVAARRERAACLSTN